MKQLNWYQIFGKSNIPDGRTVTPTDDIQIWLNCAGIFNKAYTKLAEVLADTTTLSALMASDNAVDYLVRSTTWAAPISVPTMTSNTTPSGVCIANSQYDAGHAAYKAFDSETAVCHETAGNASISSYYLGYIFPEATAINRVKLNATSYNASYYYTVAVYGGTSLDDLVKLSDNIKIQGGPTSSDYEAWFANDTEYTTYVLKIEESNASTTHSVGNYGLLVFMANFYSASVTTDSNAMTYIGQNNYAADTLLADPTWCEAICNSEYFESVLNVSVPTMTSNTTPEGLCTGTNVQSSYPAWKAFDKDNSTFSATTQVTDCIGYVFTSPVVIKKVATVNRNITGCAPITFKVQTTEDGVTWTDLTGALNNNTAQAGSASFVIENDTAHYGYALRGITSQTYTFQLAEINFYGREDV